MRNLVHKQTDLRVWRYWRTLNLVGNLDANPDPLVRDNIMFSGFTGDQINLYEAATGSTIFDEPGSLTFVWEDGRTFAYDHHSWMEAVRANFETSPTFFFSTRDVEVARHLYLTSSFDEAELAWALRFRDQFPVDVNRAPRERLLRVPGLGPRAVDAIIGAQKRMHAILPSLCSGCELCLPPCPVDCIAMVPAGRPWTGDDANAARDPAPGDRTARAKNRDAADEGRRHRI